MSSCSHGLTLKQIESLVSYPPKKRIVTKPGAHSNADSKRLLAEYKASVQETHVDRQRFKMSTWSSTSKPGATTSSLMLEQYGKAIAVGSTDDALSCLLEAVRLGENSYDAFTNIGLLLQQKGQYAEALDNFTKAVMRNPLVPESYLRRAECHMSLDRAADAVDEFEKYFKLEDPPKALMVKCGKCALDADQLEKAEWYLKGSLEREAEDAVNHAYAFYNLGELEERRGNDDLAREYFLNVCVADPTFPDPYLEQAEDEFASGNFPDSLHLFEAVAKMTPNRSNVYIRLADVYEQLGEEFTTGVLTCLSKAIDLNSTDQAELERTLVRRGGLLNGQGRYDDAIADFTVCLNANATNTAALLSRAAAFRNRDGLGDAAAAAEDYTTLVAIPSCPWTDKAEPYRYLARAAFADGDLSGAARFFGFAACAGRIEPADELLMVTAFAHAVIEAGDTTFEEAYEPRPWLAPKEADPKAGGKKAADAAKNAAGPAMPVPSFGFSAIDAYYVQLRDREPTAHSGTEYQFLSMWKPFREEVERKREEAEALRGGKKGAKKK